MEEKNNNAEKLASSSNTQQTTNTQPTVSKGIPSSNEKITQMFNSTEEEVTIMPTMIDDSEETVEAKRDLSSIIPSMPTTAPLTNTSVDNINLNSKEKELKSDGTVIIGTLDANNELTLNANVTFPEPIDIEQRKIDLQRNKNHKRREKKKKVNKKAKKLQNQISILSLIVIIGLCAFAYYYFNHKTDKDFEPINLTVELGSSLPIRVSSYVKPGVGDEVTDELLYKIDKSDVVVDEVGTYTFKVTYSGITKTGTIKIVDTTAPELEVRDQVIIVEGTEYDAKTFVKDCVDPNGCNYSFQDSETTSKYKTAGLYNVYIVATDAFDNSVTKQATLFIESETNSKLYTKTTMFNFETGYETTETYEIYYQEEYESDYPIIFTGIYTKVLQYQDSQKYEAGKKAYNGEANYTFDDSKMTITETKTIDKVGNSYVRMDNIESYLVTNNGFSVSTIQNSSINDN